MRLFSKHGEGSSKERAIASQYAMYGQLRPDGKSAFTMLVDCFYFCLDWINLDKRKWAATIEM